MHGLQLWVALPKAYEEAEPEFRHYGAPALPALEEQGVRIRVLAGTAYGATSPVETLSPLFYVEATMPEGGELPLPAEHEERAAYVTEGVVWCGGSGSRHCAWSCFAGLNARTASRITCARYAPGRRSNGWRATYLVELLSSSKARIEQAKRDWKEGRFPKVPGETEFIPLPEE